MSRKNRERIAEETIRTSKSGRLARLVQAPDEFDGCGDSVFLAGGISECRNWQTDMVEMLDSFSGTILNPRREVWPVDGAGVAQQIDWERRHLDLATLRLFWFPSETVCPITLYELGQTVGLQRPLVVATDPAYVRREDVVIQLGFASPGIVVGDSLEELARHAFSWFADSKVTS